MNQDSNGHDETIQVPCLDNFEYPYSVRLRAFPGSGENGQVRLLLKLGEAAWLSPEETRLLAEGLVVCATRVEELRAPSGRQEVRPYNAERGISP